MKNRSNSQERRLRIWRLGVSLLVIGLVLCNPFIAISGSSSGLSYQRLACNRATVGSAELQNFSFAPDTKVPPPDVNADVPRIDPAVTLQAQTPVVNQPELIPAEPEVLAGVWFRPPPSPQLF